jgi:branched-chain amino acid transport system ATP-binding protein
MGVSRTFQITRALTEMSVVENLVVHALPESLRDVMGSAVRGHDRDRAMSLLEFLGIAHLADQPAGRLSYGQRKLLELGAVLMSNPRLIMLDEPAGGVNPALLETIVERIFDLNKQGVTFLVVEHNMDLVMRISNPVIVMAAGAVIARGTPTEVQGDQAVLDAYLGGAEESA